jgi:hypothetical protein
MKKTITHRPKAKRYKVKRWKQKHKVGKKNYKGIFTKATRTPATELVAIQKFGAKNIKKLKKLGGGRDRNVYELDKNSVLKIAKNAKGLTQNDAELDLGSHYFDDDDRLDVQEAGRDYVVTEKVGRDIKIVNKFLKPFKEFNQIDFEKKTSKLQDTFHKADKGEFLNFPLAYNDFIRPSSWGVRDGKPILIDAGALNIEAISEWVSTPEKEEWEEVEAQRRKFR